MAHKLMLLFPLLLAACFKSGPVPQPVQQAGTSPILGTRPTYSSAKPATVPNGAAVQVRIWAPGLDDGYVPQGLALAEGGILVGGYRSTERKQDRGPCRVFQVYPASGAVTGAFDVPAVCGHAGGLAYDGAGTLYVVDTKAVLAVDLAAALKEGNAALAVKQTLNLGGEVRGSLGTFHDGALWIGSWNPTGPGKLFGFPAVALKALGAEATLTEAQAARRIELPPKAQGAAFDARGSLWVSLSDTKRGQFWVQDGLTGKKLAVFDVSPGVEGIAFAAPQEGRPTWLWTVAEVGSQRWLSGIAFHPLVFAVDPALLK